MNTAPGNEDSELDGEDSDYVGLDYLQDDNFWQAQVSAVLSMPRPSPQPRRFPKFNPPATKKTVLLIEDDPYDASDYGMLIEAQGFWVRHASTVEEALDSARSFRHFDAVVIDIRMHWGEFFTATETINGYKTGVLLARELINHVQGARFIALTNSRALDDRAWFEANEGAFLLKHDARPEVFARYLRRVLLKQKPRAFIVHGQDQRALSDLKNYLQNVLKFEEPLVLHEQPSKGMTIIEKFEHYSKEADIVFVLLTPDDMADALTGTGRPRQNVVLEMGFFLGHLGRRSGKVFLLAKRGVEIPSELAGIIYVDITDGMLAAGELLRRELAEFID